ncbi:MAG: porin [Pseudomonadota bacterium]
MIRRSALAIAFALAFPAVHAQSGPAQSGIQLYGIVDAGMERVDNGDANVTRLTSGLSTGSRWGIRGNEDLGGGYRALFTLESRIEVDTGAMNNRGAIFFCPSAPALCPGVVGTSPAVPATVVGGMSAVNSSLLQAVSTVNGVNALFDRQAFVGLVTPYGAVLAGRQYTPNYEVLVKYNSFADSFAGNPGQISTINIRANNALQYRAELSGFTLSLMYGFGGSEGNRNERSTVGRGDDFYGANFQYNTPRFGVGVGYNRNNTVTFAAPTENRKGLETYSVGGNATLGNVKLFATYLKAKNENPVLSPVDIQNIVISTGGNLAAINTILGGLYINRFDVDALRGVVGPIDLNVYHLGLNWTIGNGTLMAALNQAKDSARSLWATADAKVDQIGLAYMYNLSRRTQLYGAYAIANNKDQARIALGAACCTGGWTTARAEDSKSLQIGMRHSF